MSNGARRLTVEEFFHCYRPAETAQSKGMYSFLPRSPLLRLICETPNSNRDWKSRYIFMEGDEWMSHPSDNEFMPVNKTYGIMPHVCYASVYIKVHYCFKFYVCYFNCSSPVAARNRPQVSLEQWSFSKKFFNKTKLEERMWAKLVNLDTLHWYCDEPMPTATAR